MKWNNIILFILCLWTFAYSAISQPSNCPQALPSDNPGFCPSFKSIAECHCVEAGLPPGMCQDLNVLYARMIDMFGSLEQACRFQTDTAPQTCIDDWKCYRLGGVDSQGKLCSATKAACQ